MGGRPNGWAPLLRQSSVTARGPSFPRPVVGRSDSSASRHCQRRVRLPVVYVRPRRVWLGDEVSSCYITCRVGYGIPPAFSLVVLCASAGRFFARGVPALVCRVMRVLALQCEDDGRMLPWLLRRVHALRIHCRDGSSPPCGSARSGRFVAIRASSLSFSEYERSLVQCCIRWLS